MVLPVGWTDGRGKDVAGGGESGLGRGGWMDGWVEEVDQGREVCLSELGL